MYFNARIRSGNIPLCSPGYVKGVCPGGHKYASLQFCGREYCPDCAKDGSPIHQRRVKKWFEKVKGWESMGYMVITLPDFIRPFAFDRFILRDFRSKLLRKLKEDYHVPAGLCRYHWFGDCIHCSGRGCIDCEGSGSGDFWHPHLNILMPGGYIDDLESYLLPLKKWMVSFWKKILMTKIDQMISLLKYDHYGEILGEMDEMILRKNNLTIKNMIVNYSFVTEDKMKMNRVKYVTRSTFRRYNEDVKKLLYNFRNSVVFGWKKGDADAFDDTSVNCPVCEANGIIHAIKWNTLQKIDKKLLIQNESTGEQKSGLYRIRNGTDVSDTDSSKIITVIQNRVTKRISGYGFVGHSL